MAELALAFRHASVGIAGQQVAAYPTVTSFALSVTSHI